MRQIGKALVGLMAVFQGGSALSKSEDLAEANLNATWYYMESRLSRCVPSSLVARSKVEAKDKESGVHEL